MNTRSFLPGLLLLLPGLCPLSAQEEAASDPTTCSVVVTISVDWEGATLRENNLSAFEQFRQRFPDVPLTQFLNAAYFLRNESADSVVQQVRRAIRTGDELGLHIHCWRSLVEKSGVEFRTEPTFWGDGFLERAIDGDTGHAVELAAYSAEEIEKMARTARQVLRDSGFDISDSFRAGGWIASPEVLHGVRKADFLIDTSAVDRTWHQEEMGGRRIFDRLGEVWPGITPHTQPFEVETPAGNLLEMPDSCALADYVTAEEMDLHIKEVLDRVQAGAPRFVHVGFHQETAARYIGRISTFVEKWRGQPGIRFCTLQQAAEVHRAAKE